MDLSALDRASRMLSELKSITKEDGSLSTVSSRAGSPNFSNIVYFTYFYGLKKIIFMNELMNEIYMDLFSVTSMK